MCVYVSLCVYSWFIYVRGLFASVSSAMWVLAMKSGSQVGWQVPFPPRAILLAFPTITFETGSLNEPEVHQLGEVSRLVNLSDLPVSTLPPPQVRF